MLKANWQEIEAKTVEMPDVEKATIRLLIGQDAGADKFCMRMFELEPGGHTPYHTHPHEHELYFVEGTGYVRTKDGNDPFKPGDFVFIPGGEMHQFVNDSINVCRFLCLIPADAQ